MFTGGTGSMAILKNTQSRMNKHECDVNGVPIPGTCRLVSSVAVDLSDAI